MDAGDPDQETAAQLLRGEVVGIEALYDRYAGLAFGLAMRTLNDRSAADDVVQDAFLAIWRNAASFDARRGTLRGWLLAVVRHRAIDRLRGGRTTREAPLEAAALVAEDHDLWEEVVTDLERKQVREAVSSLSGDQRQTLEYAYFGGLTHLEIAERMEVPLGTVKGRMRLGLEKLRSFLQARGMEP